MVWRHSSPVVMKTLHKILIANRGRDCGPGHPRLPGDGHSDRSAVLGCGPRLAARVGHSTPRLPHGSFGSFGIFGRIFLVSIPTFNHTGRGRAHLAGIRPPGMESRTPRKGRFYETKPISCLFSTRTVDRKAIKPASSATIGRWNPL